MNRYLALVAILGLSGCQEELGPEKMPVQSVTGVVTENGRPLSRGWVEFFPVEGTVGNLRSARIEKDGTFATDGVAVGVNLVRLVHADIRNPGLSNLFTPFHSRMRRTISAAKPASIAIDLVQEAIEIQSGRARAAPATSPVPSAGAPP